MILSRSRRKPPRYAIVLPWFTDSSMRKIYPKKHDADFGPVLGITLQQMIFIIFIVTLRRETTLYSIKRLFWMPLMQLAGEESYCRLRLVQPSSDKLDSRAQTGSPTPQDARRAWPKEILQERSLQIRSARVFASGYHHWRTHRVLQCSSVKQGQEADFDRGDLGWRKLHWSLQVKVQRNSSCKDKRQEGTLQKVDGFTTARWCHQTMMGCYSFSLIIMVPPIMVSRS